MNGRTPLNQQHRQSVVADGEHRHVHGHNEGADGRQGVVLGFGRGGLEKPYLDRVAADEACRRVEAGEPAPRCRRCTGSLKPATTLFGEALPPGVLSRANAAVEQCDLLLAVGSSLEVEPAASLPRVARASSPLPTNRSIRCPAE